MKQTHLILSLFFLGMILSDLRAADIHLSPDGPISTLEAARDAARKEKKPVRIIVADGHYPRTTALELGPEDSGTTWEAAQGSKPIITGGRKITGWKEIEKGLWQATLPEKTWVFEQLWVNERRAICARTPNKGYFFLDGPVGKGVFSDVKENFNYKSFALPSDAYEILRSIPKEQRAGMLMTVTNAWTVTQCRIEDLNDRYRAVKIRAHAAYPFNEREPDQRIWFENYRAALDAPGEWYLDREKGQVLYRPLPGEELEKCEFVAPVAEKFLLVKGASQTTFRGLAFRYAQYLYPKDGFFDRQAATGIGAAIEIENASGVHFENCEISHVGEYGIYFKNGSSDSNATKCYLHDLGGGGIRVGETTRPEEDNVCRNIKIENSILQHGGRLHPSACGVTFTHTQYCAVRHCDIGDFYYTGVSTGWTWGYGDSPSRESLIENNHIHHIGWGYLSDMGGYYNVGVSPGNIVRGNHVHHVVSNRYGGWGLYTDEGSTDVTMENNLVHDTWDGGFHQHYGFFNTIRNNIFAFGHNVEIQRTRNERRLTIRYTNNIVVWDPPAPLFGGTEATWKFVEDRGKEDPQNNAIFRKNLYWRTDGKIPETLTETAYTWEEWKKMGRDTDSRFANPQFENLTQRDFRLKEDTPAKALGFVPWDLTVAGVLKDDAEWIALAAKGHDYPTWDTDARPWPLPEYGVELQTFENVAPGLIGIPKASYDSKSDPQNTGAGYFVTDEAASPLPFAGAKGPSKFSLKAQDKPDLLHSYSPVLDINPPWKDGGTFRVAFDLMTKEGADGFFEIRGHVSDFAIGPYVRWIGGKLQANNVAPIPLGDLKPGEWVRIEILATTGTDHYQVSLTRADGTKAENKNIPCKKTWTRADYALFSALANKDTAFYIDNFTMLRLTPQTTP